MRAVFLFFICLPVVFFGSFFEEEDPIHFYHVNVITGHLDLSFLDLELKSPVPFSVRRNYTSAGALNSHQRLDTELEKLRESEWMFQGGWNILTHTNLYVLSELFEETSGTFQRDKDLKYYSARKAYLYEKDGRQLVSYSHQKHWNGKDVLHSDEEIYAWRLGRRKNKSKSVLKISSEEAVLSLPDGSEKHYSGGDIRKEESFWRLDWEILPSKHRIQYEYSEKQLNSPGNLTRILLQNPSGTKTFASVDLDHSSYEKDKTLKVSTSDGRNILYQMMAKFKEISYLEQAKTPRRSKELLIYQPSRKGGGARIGGISFHDREQFRVEYYLPENKKERKRWAKGKTPLNADKIKSLFLPDPKSGEFIEFARFFYFQNYTEVKDFEGILTRYHHSVNKPTLIEYFNKSGQLHSKIKFDWVGNNLKGKFLLDSYNQVLFSKSFVYDEEDNIIEEIWKDHSPDGYAVRRFFEYNERHLVTKEYEEGGVVYTYEYFKDTDLMAKKLIHVEGKTVKREFSFYNEDHFLICQMMDDGSDPDPENLTDVTERKIARFELDPQTGLPSQTVESFLNVNTKEEIPLVTHLYGYNEKREVISERVVHGFSGKSYTLFMEYDEQGHLIRKTTPSGRENTYQYDLFGNLIRSKEVGKPEKKFKYVQGNILGKWTEGGKKTENVYDVKGRLIEQKDHLGNSLFQTYDSFGRLIETQFPEVLDDKGNSYFPKISCTYDLLGNLSSSIDPSGNTTRSTHNLFGKLTRVSFPGKSEMRHIYDVNGMLAKTIYPDKTTANYCYDPFQRITQKQIVSPSGELLNEENWSYNTFHLLTYTNPQGLTTYYTYDPMGRKIAERAEERIITFSYDDLGNLERISQEGVTKVQIHNFEGEIIQQWEEDRFGKVENRMCFFYDEEGRKERATRITSKGLVEDQFFYDEEERLIRHVNPLGEIAQFVYSFTTNSLNQKIEQKTMIDPLGNITIETFDSAGRLVKIEKKDPTNHTTAKEFFSYDKGGNKTKRVVEVYQENDHKRRYTTEWEYNERGFVTKEIEEGKKITTYKYDLRNRLIEKTTPSRIILYYQYDGIDRLLSLKSSDGTIDYSYVYDKGMNPIFAEDNVQNLTWIRQYNLFGELISETAPNHSEINWEYDEIGRCTQVLLPDRSSIEYTYSDLHLESVARYSSEREEQYIHWYSEFDENGRVAEESLIYGLGTVQTTHDLLERVEFQMTPWHTASVEYGPSGLVTKIKNSLFPTKKYAYDSLNQLKQEGGLQYSFDSLGNPNSASTNELNQIIQTFLTQFEYDPNGNLIRKVSLEDEIFYQYDSLDRLIGIHIPGKKSIHYLYDPFSRLYKKRTPEEEVYFLYDQEKEIGTYDEHHFLRELKVLGLGILGDIGGAIALELNSKVYIPLHDFIGNTIALINPIGELEDCQEIDSFGKAVLSTFSMNPWRFQSRRSEENLVFFGKRFYDPSLGRWLTPDPSGSLESPNLYLFVLNSPINRLDLFGLFSEDLYTEIPTHVLENRTTGYDSIHARAYCGDISSDWIIYSNNFHKIRLTPEELSVGKFDILDHFYELFPKDGVGIGLTTFQNGIRNDFFDFEHSMQFISGMLPGDGLFIGMHTPTQGLIPDIQSTQKERSRVETRETITTRQAMKTFAETLDKIAPNMLWLHICHSRGGTTGCAAIDGLLDEDQKLIGSKMIWLGIAPAEAILTEKVYNSFNIYSTEDCITGPYARAIEIERKCSITKEKKYNIEFLRCTSKMGEKILFHGDHSLMGKTYQEGLKKKLETMENKHGFYKDCR